MTSYEDKVQRKVHQMLMTPEDLKQKAEAQRLRVNKKVRDRARNLYQYAKSKGFSPSECNWLSMRNRALIDRLSQEKR